MKLKYGMIFLHGVLLGVGLTASQEPSSGDGVVTSQFGQSGNTNNNIRERIDRWIPRVNATCSNKHLKLADNPKCVAGKLSQTRNNCSQGVFKTTGQNYRGCVTSQREINCTADQACNDWSKWKQKTDCCRSDECDYDGIKYGPQQCVFQRSRRCGKDISKECEVENETNQDCACDRAMGIPGNEETNDKNGGGEASSGSQATSIQTIAFCLAGTVLVGLLLFAALRIKKASIQRRGEDGNSGRGRDVEGVDNAALGPLSPGSRIQSILDSIKSTGRDYELRERPDSVPGRRVYVLSPTNPLENHMGAHGRIFSRTTSQLSSIAEESAEDALSHITEATEPVGDDYIFKYDSDAINDLNNGQSDCAFGEPFKPASSSEAINCINDVIAMYDEEKEENGIQDMLKRNSLMSPTDYRKSNEIKEDDYLKNFGWQPQERPWRVERLKDETSKSTDPFSASCSTLNSIYSERSVASSASPPDNCDVMTDGEESSTDPLLGDVTSPNLQNSKAFKSLPSLLDTSQIPDIEEVLRSDVENGLCDVPARGSVCA